MVAELTRLDAPYPIEDRSFIPRERYYDQEFFDLEIEKLWPHTWQMACRLEEIPGVGDYAEYRVGPYSVVVVRIGPDKIKAYQNACRHRATALAEGCGTFRGGQIVCPFHGWRWNLDGSPTRPLYGEEGFDPACLGDEDLRLIECLVDTWAGCVFVNMDRDAPPLREALDPMPGMLDPLRIDRMHVYWWKGVRVNANWKIAQEAFMEGWHLPQTHPQLTQGLGMEYPPNRTAHTSLPNGHNYFVAATGGQAQNEIGQAAGRTEAEAAIAYAKMMCEGGVMVLPKDVRIFEGLRTIDYEPGTFSQKVMGAMVAWNKGAGIPFPEMDPSALGRWGGDFFMFPNLFFLPLFGNALMYRVRPDSTDPEHCLFEMWMLTLYPEGEEPGKPTRVDLPADDPGWPLVPRQDFSNIERQQRGLHTPDFRGLRLSSEWEHGIANMHAHLDTYLATS